MYTTLGLIKQYITDFPNDQELGKKVRDLILTTDEQLAQFVVVSNSTIKPGKTRVDAFFADEKMAELFVETIKTRRDSVHREYYVFPVMPPF